MRAPRAATPARPACAPELGCVQDLVQYLLLDLARLRSVERFIDQVQAIKRPIDYLILNAGVAYYPHTLTEDGFELQVGACAAPGTPLAGGYLWKELGCAGRADLVPAADGHQPHGPLPHRGAPAAAAAGSGSAPLPVGRAAGHGRCPSQQARHLS